MAWGSGMNALYTYLSIPFIALLGLTKLAIRLPQALFGTATVALAYYLGKAVKDEKFGLIFAGLLAVCPWHIMLSRWGLESNLVVFFLCAGVLTFLKGVHENPRWLLLCAVCYGLSLYCYATVWLVVPLILLLELLYALRRGLLHWKTLVAPLLILGLLAAPLLVFVAVNLDWMEEVRTPIFSIPRLLSMRSSEYALSALPGNAKALLRLLISQSDGNRYNALPHFGLFYLFSLPLILGGAIGLGVKSWAMRNKKEKNGALCVAFQAVATLPAALLLTNININKCNSLHLPLLFLCAYALDWLVGQAPKLRWAALAAYAISFLLFTGAYFKTDTPHFFPEVGDALRAASQTEGTVYVSDVMYPIFLFDMEYPTDKFVSEAEYANYPNPYLTLRALGRYRFDPFSHPLDTSSHYLCYRSSTLIPTLLDAGFTEIPFGDYALYTHP